MEHFICLILVLISILIGNNHVKTLTNKSQTRLDYITISQDTKDEVNIKYAKLLLNRLGINKDFISNGNKLKNHQLATNQEHISLFMYRLKNSIRNEKNKVLMSKDYERSNVIKSFYGINKVIY